MSSRSFKPLIPITMSKEYISIQDAADLSNKSVQTIRRAIKAKKIKVRKQKTPQGFNYMVNMTTLCEAFSIKQRGAAPEEAVTKKIEETREETRNDFDAQVKSKTMSVEVDDFKAFVSTMETLISQHNDERQNFLRLINTMQEKIFVLENQLNLLKAPQKKWFSFWK